MEKATVKAPKATKSKAQNAGFKGIKAAWIVMVVCFVIAYCFYEFVALYGRSGFCNKREYGFCTTVLVGALFGGTISRANVYRRQHRRR